MKEQLRKLLAESPDVRLVDVPDDYAEPLTYVATPAAARLIVFLVNNAQAIAAALP